MNTIFTFYSLPPITAELFVTTARSGGPLGARHSESIAGDRTAEALLSLRHGLCENNVIGLL